MDLELDIASLTAPGRKALPLTGAIVRALRPADLALLLTADRGTSNPPLKKLTERHHTLARALAAGNKPGEAAVAIGFSPARVSVLKSSPAFQELVEFYRTSIDAEYADFHNRMAGLGKDAVLELTERLEENPEDFKTQDLLRLTTEMADRTGYGPSKTDNVNVTVDVGARLADARKRAKAIALESMKDVTPDA